MTNKISQAHFTLLMILPPGSLVLLAGQAMIDYQYICLFRTCKEVSSLCRCRITPCLQRRPHHLHLLRHFRCFLSLIKNTDTIFCAFCCRCRISVRVIRDPLREYHSACSSSGNAHFLRRRVRQYNRCSRQTADYNRRRCHLRRRFPRRKRDPDRFLTPSSPSEFPS